MVLYPPAPQVIGPIANDLGYPAWSVSGLALPSQFIYQSGALNAAQKADINSQGFTLTLRGRVLQGSAPAFDVYNTVIGWVSLDTGTRRYDLALGVNSSGNTVAVLVTNLDGLGPGPSVRGFGSTYALNDASYHTYDLVFNPQAQSASLFIDGVERLSGYTGSPNLLADRGLYFGATSGGGMNFNLVRLTSPAVVPVACNELIGETLQTCSNHEFSLEQGTQKTDFIPLINPSTVSLRTATLEVINPHSALAVSVTEPNPVSIAPGETKTLSIDVNAGATPVGAYDDLLLKVTADDGSTLYSNLAVYVTPPEAGPLPDLAITADDIGSVANADGSVTLTATVHNRGTATASNVQVRFYEFANELESPPLIAQIAPNGIGSTSITLPAPTAGDHLIRVVVDPAGAEPDNTNNEASRLIPIGSSVPTEGNILVTGSLPATVYTNTLFTLNGRAVYDLYVNGVRYTDYVVKGGVVQITVREDSGAAEWVYGDVHTDVNGHFLKTLQAPATPGTYRITMTVTDKTFVGTRELVFVVAEPGPTPPLQTPPPTWGTGHFEWNGVAFQWVWDHLVLTGPVPQQDIFVYSDDLYFSNNHPAAGEEITVFAAIRFWASNSAGVAQNVPVNVYATSPGTPPVKIGETLLQSLAAGSPDFGARYVYATWKNSGDGIYLIEFAIDSSYVEANLLNNAATRAIIVGQLAGGAQGAIAGQVTVPLGSRGNVVIQVLDGNGQPIGNAVTDATGYYLVGNVPLGPVQVHIVTPNGYVPDAETKAVTVAQQAVSTVDFHLTPPPPDTTPPIITPTVSGTQGNNGWYKSDVTVSWEVTDAESDVTFTNGCGTATVSTDTAGVTFTCSATSSGGTTSETVTVQRDATPPTIVGSASPAANANGWNNSSVTVSFTCDDALSGIATCTAPQTLNQGANQTASGTATDKAGNTASAQITGINIDLTPPTVAVTGVTDGAIYTGTAPPADCETSDALSRVQTFATVNVTGGDANGLGTFVASCAGAMDRAGNAGATVSVSYQVIGAVGPINTGALTIGFWRNKNGQALITGGASSGGVCNSGVWLRQYAPYQDLSATATCPQVGTYVTNLINAANASGSSMNLMLKAQMLATALSVYFSDPALGGNRIAASAPIGEVSIDLTKICGMIDTSSGTASCSGVYQDVGDAFGGVANLTVSRMLAHAAGQSDAGGSLWYGNVKATQELAKNAFDAINNRVAFAP
ncbi:MAG: CARDB domain-containing protein [Candidatus Competibacter sp.]